MGENETGMMEVHATALVHPNAALGEGTKIGAYSIIGEHVVLGKGCEIQEHVVIRGRTELGDEVRVFPFATLGAEPQHTNYKGEPTRVEVGDRSIIRECVTIHRGTEFGNHVTRVGRDAFIMAYSHVAHDCVVGDHVVLANSVHLAGHATVEDYATIGGLSAMAQFSRVGQSSYIGGGSAIRKDVPPYMLGKGFEFSMQGVNVVGLARRGISGPIISRLKTLYKIFYLQNLTTSRAIEKAVMELGEHDEIKAFIEFVQSSKIGIAR